MEMIGEDSLAGTGNVNDLRTKSITNGDVNMFNLKIELNKHIRHCSSIPLVSSCIKDFYFRKYGNNYENKYLATHDEQLVKYAGKDKLYEVTGCQVPCQQTKYILEDFMTSDIDSMNDPEIQNFLSKHNSGGNVSMIVISHHKSNTIIQNEEVIEYDASRIISEVGGIVGIFIGLSFWSIYLDICEPILSFIKNNFI